MTFASIFERIQPKVSPSQLSEAVLLQSDIVSQLLEHSFDCKEKNSNRRTLKNVRKRLNSIISKTDESTLTVQ